MQDAISPERFAIAKIVIDPANKERKSCAMVISGTMHDRPQYSFRLTETTPIDRRTSRSRTGLRVLEFIRDSFELPGFPQESASLPEVDHVLAQGPQPLLHFRRAKSRISLHLFPLPLRRLQFVLKAARVSRR